MSDEVGSVEKRSRLRWLVPSVVAAVLAASAAAGWVEWSDQSRSPEALPNDFCAFVLPLLEGAMPNAKPLRHPAPLIQKNTTVVGCELRQIGADGAVTGIRVDQGGTDGW